MTKSIRMIGMSILAAGLSLLLPLAVARAQDSVFVTTTGDVGIGTSTPAVRLDVQMNSSSAATARLQNASAIGVSGIEYLDETSAVNLFFGIDNAANTTRLNSINNHPIVILTNSTERARVTSAGDVGIGTAAPGARLDVQVNAPSVATARLQNQNASGFSGIEFLNENSLVTLFFGVDNAANTTRFNSIQNHPIVILTESTERARVTSAGDVGIGTSSPISKLHVNGGDIRVSGGSFIDDNVTLFAPDYVFEPDYKLMPLDELAAFVHAEKHLPNVPKAAEIRASGLNLSQFQMRLLEKIEELTLYALAQEEQLATQQATIAELAAKVEKLEEP